MRQARKLVEEVLALCEADDTGTTWELYDQALRAGEELGMSPKELGLESDDDFEDEEQE